MARTPISEKVLEKWQKEDLELHKRVITTYLFERKIKLKTRNKFFALYDMFIHPGNIYDFFYVPVNIFVQALVSDELDKIQSYVQSPNPNRPKKKTKKRKRK